MDKRYLERIALNIWEIPRSYRGDMNVPARLYASERLIDSVLSDRSVEQLVNVAALPGIRDYAIAMPDVHEGYGFPIGGVAAIDPEHGVISPGGIGYDINCGVRLLRTPLTLDEVKPHLEKIAHSIAREIPSGTGRGGAFRVKGTDLDRVLEEGAGRMVEMGYGDAADLDRIESRGCLQPAEAKLVSERARARGADQLGSLGSGNHFVEIDVVDRLFDEAAAKPLGLVKDGIVVLIHTGSRGLGHQVATDFLRVMTSAMRRYGIRVPDPQLACAPFRSEEGQQYFRAMSAAANFAFANRQMITAGIRRAWPDTTLDLVYDVAHNVAKVEKHHGTELVVHRKGATRAFPGQAVLIPGSMGTASYVLLGAAKSMEETFGSTCHGAGRVMSRSRAKKEISVGELRERLQKMGIIAVAQSAAGLVEEAPEAYKDVDEVVGVVEQAGIATRVARLRPVAVIKG